MVAHPLMPIWTAATEEAILALGAGDPRSRPDALEAMHPTAAWFPRWRGRVERLAARTGSAVVGGSDAHATRSIGRGWTGSTERPLRTCSPRSAPGRPEQAARARRCATSCPSSGARRPHPAAGIAPTGSAEGRPASATRRDSVPLNDRATRIHLHLVQARPPLSARPDRARGHLDLVLPGRQDRRHRPERGREVQPAPDHGRARRRLLGRGPPDAGLHRRLPQPGTAARPGQGRQGQRHGRRPRGPGPDRSLQRRHGQVVRPGRGLRGDRASSRQPSRTTSRRPTRGTSNATSRSPWMRCAARRTTPT